MVSGFIISGYLHLVTVQLLRGTIEKNAGVISVLRKNNYLHTRESEINQCLIDTDWFRLWENHKLPHTVDRFYLQCLVGLNVLSSTWKGTNDGVTSWRDRIEYSTGDKRSGQDTKYLPFARLNDWFKGRRLRAVWLLPISITSAGLVLLGLARSGRDFFPATACLRASLQPLVSITTVLPKNPC